MLDHLVDPHLGTPLGAPPLAQHTSGSPIGGTLREITLGNEKGEYPSGDQIEEISGGTPHEGRPWGNSSGTPLPGPPLGSSIAEINVTPIGAPLMALPWETPSWTHIVGHTLRDTGGGPFVVENYLGALAGNL